MVRLRDKMPSQADQECIRHLVWLCKRAGERFDLVQAAGGNASFRTADELLIVKGSGITLSGVSRESGLTTLDNSLLTELLKELKEGCRHRLAAELESMACDVTQSAVIRGARPSIETLLHALLGPYTLHTHPIAVTSLVCRSNWQSMARQLVPGAILIPYHTPGARLALAVGEEILKHKPHAESPTVILLENHGLVVAGNDAETVFSTTNAVTKRIALQLNQNLEHYALTNAVSGLINRVCQTDLCAYLSEDPLLQNAQALIAAPPACPDQVVYAGPQALYLSSLQQAEAVENFYRRLRQPPKVVALADRLFLLGTDIRKCRELEEVLKAHVMTVRSAASALTPLDAREVEYLLEWEAEKYRQKL